MLLIIAIIMIAIILGIYYYTVVLEQDPKKEEKRENIKWTVLPVIGIVIVIFMVISNVNNIKNDDASTTSNTEYVGSNTPNKNVESNEAPNTTDKTNAKDLIPGLTSGDIKVNLENTWKLKFSGPKQADNMYLDRGEVIDPDTGVKLICIIYEYSPMEIYSIDFVIDASAVVGIIDTDTVNEVSKGYLGYCATVPYDGSDGQKAQEWIQANVSQVVKAGQTINTTIGKVNFELFGAQYVKTLRLTPIK